ncbi:pyridoxamine 5'-phosphate oxidase [Insolitispirillum peregrinum]|uniref:pyridoxamine 5'-phosphate oxidase n=1 Tax=Insolitispirillum peregrinum TaxID=80876 RepID=UPI003608076C
MNDFSADVDPIAQFSDWLAEAGKSEPNDPNAVCLATSTPDGFPSARMVLLKGHDEHGFVFYTNLESRKGGELAANPKAAMCFHWKSLKRQVRIEGLIEPVTAEEADAYYASRARDSRIGAWASQQSRPLQSRFELESRIAEYVAKFGLGRIPRPPFWSGFRLVPVRIEFWRDRPFRLHDRMIYKRNLKDEPWTTERLYP